MASFVVVGIIVSATLRSTELVRIGFSLFKSFLKETLVYLCIGSERSRCPFLSHCLGKALRYKGFRGSPTRTLEPLQDKGFVALVPIGSHSPPFRPMGHRVPVHP